MVTCVGSLDQPLEQQAGQMDGSPTSERTPLVPHSLQHQQILLETICSKIPADFPNRMALIREIFASFLGDLAQLIDPGSYVFLHGKPQLSNFCLEVEAAFRHSKFSAVFITPLHSCPRCSTKLGVHGVSEAILFTIQGPQKVTHVRLVLLCSFLTF